MTKLQEIVLRHRDCSTYGFCTVERPRTNERYERLAECSLLRDARRMGIDLDKLAQLEVDLDATALRLGEVTRQREELEKTLHEIWVIATDALNGEPRKKAIKQIYDLIPVTSTSDAQAVAETIREQNRGSVLKGIAAEHGYERPTHHSAPFTNVKWPK